MTFPRLQNQLAFDMQCAIGDLLEGKKMLADVMELYREHLKKVAETTVEIVQIPPPTHQDKREAPVWAETIELQRENVESRARHFFIGV